MARPATITDEQILDAARAVFLEKGIRATASEVAQRAGIAEGSIFNRFKTKHDLFRAAMKLQLDEPPWVESMLARVGRGDLRENLTEVGLEVIGFFRTVLPLMMMSWSNPGTPGGEDHPLSRPNPPPLRNLRKVIGFFEAELHAGRLGRHDPEILARCYMGSLLNFAFFEVLMKANDELPMAAERFVRELVHLLWTGAEPRES